jgi:uncharacterized membrane protein
MSNPRYASHWIALGGLLILITVILLPGLSVWRIIVASPLILFLVTGLRPRPRWGGWVAVAMIPYLCVAIGEAIVDPENRLTYTVIVGSTLLVFAASMIFVRATGASLRR